MLRLMWDGREGQDWTEKRAGELAKEPEPRECDQEGKEWGKSGKKARPKS